MPCFSFGMSLRGFLLHRSFVYIIYKAGECFSKKDVYYNLKSAAAGAVLGGMLGSSSTAITTIRMVS